jgi:hypothetical protein
MSRDPSTVGSVTSYSITKDQVKSTKQTGLSPFEVPYGHPLPLNPGHMR